MKSRQEKAVEEILLGNYDSYYRLAYSYVHSEADAADIVQNGAYHAIRASGSLKELRYASTWVYRIMLNEIFSFCRNNAKIVFLEDVNEDAVSGKEDIYGDIDLQRALDLLPAKDKAVIELKFFEEKSFEEIAQIMDEKSSTVKSRLYRAVKKLRLEMED